jgi:hypothetical protein
MYSLRVHPFLQLIPPPSYSKPLPITPMPSPVVPVSLVVNNCMAYLLKKNTLLLSKEKRDTLLTLSFFPI